MSSAKGEGDADLGVSFPHSLGHCFSMKHRRSRLAAVAEKCFGLMKPERRLCEHPLSGWPDKQFSVRFCQKILHMEGIYFLLSVR